MVRYACDWCGQGKPLDDLRIVDVSSAYEPPARLHLCQGCANQYFPPRFRQTVSRHALNP